jgi:hypothetical protein
MKTVKSWEEKLHKTNTTKVEKLEKKFSDMPIGSLMFIATPMLINNYINDIPKGKAVAVTTMRKDIAIENNADNCCPLTTGIFLRIVAEAAHEKYAKTNSLKGITPFWRVVAPNSPLAKKLSFGQDFLMEMVQKEKIEFTK